MTATNAPCTARDEFLSGECLLLGAFEIGYVDTGADDSVNATRGVSYGDEVRVEVPPPSRQMKFIFIGDGRARFQTAAIARTQLHSEPIREHFFDEFAGYFCVSKAQCLLFGRVEPRELGTAIRGDINQEHAYRDVVEHFLVLQLNFAQRFVIMAVRLLKRTTHVADHFFQLCDARLKSMGFLFSGNSFSFGVFMESRP